MTRTDVAVLPSFQDGFLQNMADLNTHLKTAITLVQYLSCIVRFYLFLFQNQYLHAYWCNIYLFAPAFKKSSSVFLYVSITHFFISASTFAMSPLIARKTQIYCMSGWKKSNDGSQGN